MRDIPVASTELLTSYLADGRGSPELTSRTILSATDWLNDLGINGTLAVATFATSHDAFAVAADAFLRMAELDKTRTGRWKAFAAANLASIDKPAARELYIQATQSPDDPLIAHVGLALVSLPDDRFAPIEVDADLERRLNDNPDVVESVMFRANVAEHAHRWSDAVGLWERARILDVDSKEIALELAQALSFRAGTSGRESDDLTRAVLVAESALDETRRWSGPTADCVRVLSRGLAAIHQPRKLLQVAVPPPVGSATVAEAGAPGVGLAAVMAALVIDDVELARELAARLTTHSDQIYARAVLAPADQPDADASELWLGVLDAIEDDEPEMVVRAAMHVAGLGIDRSDRLDGLADSGTIRRSLLDAVVAIASARRDLDNGLPKLRLCAGNEPVAAQHLIDCLAESGRHSQAIEAALAAHGRFGDSNFRAQAMMILDECDPPRADEAAALANAMIADPGALALHRENAHSLLASHAAQSRDWRLAEAHLMQRIALAEPEVPGTAVWRLVQAQYYSGAPDRAWKTIQDRRPPIDDEEAAHMWAEVASTQPMTSAIASEMIRLADLFAHHPQLSSALLTQVIMSTRAGDDDEAGSQIDQRPVVDGSLRAQAFTGLNRLITEHGDEVPIRRLEATTPEAGVEQIFEMLRQHNDEPLRQVIGMTVNGQLPLGMVAEASGRPYGLVLSQRGVGHFIAGPASEDDSELAKQAVAGAFDRPVVVDESSLLVASILGVFDQARSRFSRLLVPDVAGRDVRRSRVSALNLTGSSGSLSWNSTLNRPVLVEIETEELMASMKRLSLLEGAIALTEPRPVSRIAIAADAEADLTGTWLASVQLAKDLGRPLWADDTCLRLVARELGVAAFGTLDIIEHIRDERLARLRAGRRRRTRCRPAGVARACPNSFGTASR